MNDITITALTQAEIKDALAQLKQLSEYPTPSTQYARVLRKYIASLVEAQEAKQPHHNGMMQLSNELVMAKQRIAELEKAAAEPVAWTDEVELRAVEKDGCGYLFKANPITPHADPRRVIKLYTVSPALESRTVTVKLPAYDRFFEYAAQARSNRDEQWRAALAKVGIKVIEGEGQ